MFEQLVAAMTDYPYLVVGIVFVVCGLGLPLPEEIVLLAAGYFCAKRPDLASLPWMMLWSAAAILAGDLLPFLAGKVFGARLLRLRWMRYLVTKKRLANFDRWFRRRGDLVILIARFVAGLRMVAFFTAGTMKMRWSRFLLLDGLGIGLLVPLLTLLGFHSAGFIDELIVTVAQVERGILWAAIGGGVGLLLWYGLWQRRQQSATTRPKEAYVEPQRPVVGIPRPDAAEPGDDDQPSQPNPPASRPTP
jgi:membrane protein DedA with SNARE-associated domain